MTRLTWNLRSESRCRSARGMSLCERLPGNRASGCFNFDWSMKLGFRINRAHLAAAFGALLAVGCGLALSEFKFGSGLVRSSYGLLHVFRGDLAAQDAVIVCMDEVSYEKLGQPENAPWDRALHAKLIERLTAAGARAIAFDVVFSDPIPSKVEADVLLAEAIKPSGRVILAADNVPIGPGAKKIIPP